MADVFGTGSRGCFALVKHNAAEAIGAQFIFADQGSFPAAQTDPYLVTGFRLSKEEVVSHNKTFGGGIYTYAFGHNPSSGILDVSLTAFMGGMAQGQDPITALNDAYNSARVSQSQARAKLAIGSAALEGYVVGMAAQTASPELNLQDFTVHLAITEL